MISLRMPLDGIEDGMVSEETVIPASVDRITKGGLLPQEPIVPTAISAPLASTIRFMFVEKVQLGQLIPFELDPLTPNVLRLKLHVLRDTSFTTDTAVVPDMVAALIALKLATESPAL